MAPKRKAPVDDSSDVEYVPLPATRQFSTPAFNLDEMLRMGHSRSTPTSTGQSAAPASSSTSAAPAAASSAAATSLVMPSRFQSSEESSPGAGETGDGKSKKEKKSNRRGKGKKQEKKSKKGRKNHDEDDDDEALDPDHQPIDEEDDDEDDFTDLAGYDELVGLQEGSKESSKETKKRPATARATQPKKRPAKKHEALPFQHMIEGEGDGILATDERANCAMTMAQYELMERFPEFYDSPLPFVPLGSPEPCVKTPERPERANANNADGDSCYAATLIDPESARSYFPDNQLGLDTQERLLWRTETPEPSPREEAVPPLHRLAAHEDLGSVLERQEALREEMDIQQEIESDVEMDAAGGAECPSPTAAECPSPTAAERRSPTAAECPSPTAAECLSPTGAECPSPTAAECPSPTGAVDPIPTPVRASINSPEVCTPKLMTPKPKTRPQRSTRGRKVQLKGSKKQAAPKVSPKNKETAKKEKATKESQKPGLKHKDETQRKLHSVYSGAHKLAKAKGLSAEKCKAAAVKARLAWAKAEGPVDHPAVVALLQ